MVDEFPRSYLCSGHFTPNGANFLGSALLFLAYNSPHNPCVLGIEPQCRSWVLWFWLITQGAWAQHASEVTNQNFHSLEVVWREQFSHGGAVDCIPLQMVCSGFHSSRSSHMFGTGSILMLICQRPGGRYSLRPLRMTQVTQLLKFHWALKENPKQNLYPANKTSIFHPCEY